MVSKRVFLVGGLLSVLIIASAAAIYYVRPSADVIFQESAQASYLNQSFGTNGKVVFNNTSLIRPVLYNNDKIYLVDFHKKAIIRLNADGTTDGTFSDGRSHTFVDDTTRDYILSIALQNVNADTNLLVLGTMEKGGGISSNSIVRLLSNGQVDPSFGISGKVDLPTDWVGTNQLEVYPGDNSFLVAGRVKNKEKVTTGTNEYEVDSQDIVIVRYLANGQLDVTFGSNGLVTIGFEAGFMENAERLFFLPNQTGSFLMIGRGITRNNVNITPDSSINLARFDRSGRLDQSYGTAGISVHRLSQFYDYRHRLMGLHPESDGSIMALYDNLNSKSSNKNEFSFIHFTQNGDLDASFGEGGRKIYTLDKNGTLDLSLRQDDNTYLVSRSLDDNPDDLTNKKVHKEIRRYRGDGTLDSTYGLDGVLTFDFSNNDGVSTMEAAKRSKSAQEPLILLAATGAYNNSSDDQRKSTLIELMNKPQNVGTTQTSTSPVTSPSPTSTRAILSLPVDDNIQSTSVVSSQVTQAPTSSQIASTSSSTPTIAQASASSSPTPSESVTLASSVNTGVIASLTVGNDSTNIAQRPNKPQVETGQGMMIRTVPDPDVANKQVTVTVASEPKTYTVDADSTGAWFIYLDTKDLELGEHHVYYETATKPKTQILAFQIVEASETVSPSMMTMTPKPVKSTPAPTKLTTSGLPAWLLWIAGLITLMIALIGYSLYRKHSKTEINV